MRKLFLVIAIATAGCVSTASQPINSEPYVFLPQNEYWRSLVRVEPNYPEKALINGIEGCAKVEFIVDKGKVVSAKVVKAVPEGFFERETVYPYLRYNKYAQGSANNNSQPIVFHEVVGFSLDNNSLNLETQKAKCA